jgi:hypothetical protein
VWQTLQFLFSVAWLGPTEGSLHWMIPAAIALLLLPCLYLSLVIERWSCRRTWTTADPAQVRQGVLAVNLASYALLFLLACGWTSFELATKGPRLARFRTQGDPAPTVHPFPSATNGTPPAMDSLR